MTKNKIFIIIIIAVLIPFSDGVTAKNETMAMNVNKNMTTPMAGQKSILSEKPIKAVFIHHSVGGRWLAHDHGGLTSELNRHNIYVNDITYGWEPPELTSNLWKKIVRKIISLFRLDQKGIYGIGNRTDIGHWYEWFCGKYRDRIMEAVYKENKETTVFGRHENGTSKFPLANPGLDVENEVIIIKPCYPNSLYRGKGDDPATTGSNPPRNFSADSGDHTVANSKRIFIDILEYFKKRPDKFFVIVTAPPRTELPDKGKIARAFNNWVVHNWLKENNYSGKNVMVFDLFNVLTSGRDQTRNDLDQSWGNHHRIWNGEEQHVVQVDNHLLFYPRGGTDNHPSAVGMNKASAEFVPLLVKRYKQWKASTQKKN